MTLEKLVTEEHHELSEQLDEMSIAEITACINQQDQTVALAVKKALPQINQAIELAVSCLQRGGRLIYMGAGTSGRLGVLDASECPPTFGVSDSLVQGLIAGGSAAIMTAQEGAEDDKGAAKSDLKAVNLTDKDCVVGIAASGRTPYVLSGLQYAQAIGATTIGLVCVPDAEISFEVQAPIEVVVGPEIITGSSRMKAGTAQKMVLNMLSTTCMIQLGKIYRGYMVDVQPTNQKLKDRALRIVMATTHVSQAEAIEMLEKVDYRVKIAIICLLTHLDQAAAQQILSEHRDHIASAIKQYTHKKGVL